MNYYDEERHYQYQEEDRLSKQADKITSALKGQFAPKTDGDSNYIIQKLKGEFKNV